MPLCVPEAVVLHRHADQGCAVAEVAPLHIGPARLITMAETVCTVGHNLVQHLAEGGGDTRGWRGVS